MMDRHARPHPKVEIEVDGLGHGRLLIDGVDWSNRITGFELSAHVADATRLTLHMAAVDVHAHGEAEVTTDDDTED